MFTFVNKFLNFFYPSFLFIYLFFFKDLSHSCAYITHLNYIYIYMYVYPMIPMFPLFFHCSSILLLWFHYFPSCLSCDFLYQNRFWIMFAFHFMIRSLNCSFLSILSLERFTSIEFFFFFFLRYPNFTILRLNRIYLLTVPLILLELFFITLFYNMIINLYRVINT